MMKPQKNENTTTTIPISYILFMKIMHIYNYSNAPSAGKGI